MKNGRTYAVVDLAVFRQADFTTAKSVKQQDGVLPRLITTSYGSMRKSLDGTLGIVKWREAEPVGLKGVLFSGDLARIQQYLEANTKAWDHSLAAQQTKGIDEVIPIVKPVRMEGAGETAFVPPAPPRTWKKWAVGAAIAAAAAAGAAYFRYDRAYIEKPVDSSLRSLPVP